jgi:hypothetical protein
MRTVLAAGCLCGALMAAAPAAAQVAPERYLVIPFDNPSHDTRIYWLGEAAAMLLTDNLNATGHHAYMREERLEAFEQLQVPAAATLSHATIIRLGELVGASHIVIGSLAIDGAQM